MHNHDDKYPARPGYEPGTSRLQAPVDTNEPSGSASIFSSSYVQKVPCSEGLKFRSYYILKLLYSEYSLLKKKEEQHKKPHRKRRKMWHEEQKVNSSCARKVKKRGTRGEREARRREISGTRHGAKTKDVTSKMQCKKGRGANHSAGRSAVCKQDAAQ